MVLRRYETPASPPKDLDYYAILSPKDRNLCQIPTPVDAFLFCFNQKWRI